MVLKTSIYPPRPYLSELIYNDLTSDKDMASGTIPARKLPKNIAIERLKSRSMASILQDGNLGWFKYLLMFFSSQHATNNKYFMHHKHLLQSMKLRDFRNLGHSWN